MEIYASQNISDELFSVELEKNMKYTKVFVDAGVGEIKRKIRHLTINNEIKHFRCIYVTICDRVYL